MADKNVFIGNVLIIENIQTVRQFQINFKKVLILKFLDITMNIKKNSLVNKNYHYCIYVCNSFVMCNNYYCSFSFSLLRYTNLFLLSQKLTNTSCMFYLLNSKLIDDTNIYFDIRNNNLGENYFG